MMDPSSSSATTLARPRFALAIISAAAAVTVGAYLLREIFSTTGHPRGLHRSNAIRRRRRAPQARRDSTASTTSAESQGDETGDENHDENRDVNHNDADREIFAEGGALQPQPDGETVAEELVADWWDDAQHMNQPRSGQNIVSLLFRVSEDNARRNAYVHRGCACNACGIVPIRGVRYRCANCADFDLCETCESQGMHIKTHIFYKVKIPAPPFGPRQMQPVVYPGDPDTCIRSLPRALMIRLSRETGFERPELEAFWEQWTFIANTEWREDPDDLCLAMDRRTFERCLVPSGGYRHAAPNLIHDRMFAFYDTNNDDLIGFSEFLHGLAYRKRPDKLKRIFEGYDVDRDGYVDRRDFLRLFRAYYVLFKQMHKYILEGLDDQVMSSTEAHQLVTSRQPLSSLFGREGRVPDADQDRVMEGKVFHGNGDVALAGASNGVVNGDKADTSGREEILTSLFSRGSPPQPFLVEPMFSPDTIGPQSPHGGDAGSRYFDSLLNPPRSTQELQSVITDEPRNTLDNFLHALEEREREGIDLGSRSQTMGDHGANGSRNTGHSHDDWDFYTMQPEGVRLQMDDDRMPYDGDTDIYDERQRVRVTKKTRIAARKKLHERWKRRRFYLDEEEGAHAPEGWNPAHDFLADSKVGGTEGTKTTKDPIPMSPRSRSSSKVRFAEDTDDYEVRSNPSTSSRSVPERWGGMEIPDAERDAGREILYQVTQQAFNELLDVLFKKKEDLAVNAATTREDRNRYRKYFESIDLDEEDGKKQQPVLSATPPPERRRENDEDTVLQTETPEPSPSSDRNGHPPANGEHEQEDNHDHQQSHLEIDAAHEAAIGAWPGRHVSLPDQGEVESPGFDPTMPQFRPNSDADIATRPPLGFNSQDQNAGAAPLNSRAQSDYSGESTSAEDAESIAQRGEDSGPGSAHDEDDDESSARVLPRYMLVEWKRLDLAEEEQRQRGGWGKLSYEEFEEIYRREERHSNRLDYLGSWIDVCIPYS